MGTRKLASDDKTTRFMRFLALLLNSRGPSRYADFSDTRIWGSERNMKRFLTDINADWSRVFGRELIEKQVVGGMTEISLADEAIAGLRDGRHVAVMFAATEFLGALRGSLITDELKPISDRMTARLQAADKRRFERLRKKFIYVSKGRKDYSKEPLRDVLDAVYTSLVKECELSVTIDKDGKPSTFTLLPVSMVLFNSSLYLIAMPKDKPAGTRPRTYRLEKFSDATALISRKITPAPFNAEDFYSDYFGLSTGDGSERRQKVVLEFAANEGLQNYIKERRWSGNDKCENLRGGGMRLTMQLKLTAELTTWILGMGANVKVLEPKALVDDVKRSVKAMAGLY